MNGFGGIRALSGASGPRGGAAAVFAESGCASGCLGGLWTPIAAHAALRASSAEANAVWCSLGVLAVSAACPVLCGLGNFLFAAIMESRADL